MKVFVDRFDGTIAIPTAIAQVSITPLGGGPVIKQTLKVSVKKRGAHNAAIITLSSASIGANAVIDSFNSNPGGGTTGTRLAYPGNGATANGNVITLGGSLSLGSKAVVNGNVLLGSGVAAPSASQVTGSIIPNYTGSYPSPAWPAWPTRTGYYGLASIPATLPRTGDVPSSDGRFYYYPRLIISPLPVGTVTIEAGEDVTIYASSVGFGLALEADATCITWTLGSVSTAGSAGWTNPNWAGALQIYSLGTSVTLGHSSSTTACIYAPLASVTLNGGGSSPTFTGSIVSNTFSSSGNGWRIRYDESLNNLSTSVGTGWSMLKWYDLQGTAESRTFAAVTGNFLN